MKKTLVILTGPTAVGKTELSIELAKAINGEIISADSIQIYKHMDIGSAKIKPDEMQNVRHYLIDELEPDEEFNIYKFKEMSLKYMDDIYSRGKTPIIVGGTGFYIQGILYDINFTENNSDMSYRNELTKLYNTMGPEALHDILKNVDPESAKKIHYNNVKRVIRALEYYKQTGKKISEHNDEQRDNISPYNFKYFVLNDDRELLYKRIDNRVDQMIEKGLVDEVRNLQRMGYTREMLSMQGIGYKEIYSYILNEITLDEATELIKKNTRHFAKRQLTWFRREKEVTWVDYREFNGDKEKMLAYMINEFNNVRMEKNNEQ